MRILAIALLASVALAALATPAEACSYFGCPQMIDDFTQGALPPAPGPHDFTHVGLPTQSNLGGERRVVVADVEGHTGGMIAAGGGDIWFEMQTVNDRGTVSAWDPDIMLDYELNGADLTAGGGNDRIVVDIEEIDDMSIFVVFSYQGGSIAKHFFPSAPGSFEILFGQFAPHVDMSTVDRVQFMFHRSSSIGSTKMVISRIRTKSSLGRRLFWQVPTLIEYGPPYPLPGPLMDNLYVDEMGNNTLTTTIFPVLNFARYIGFSQFYPVDMQSSTSDPRGNPAWVAGFEVVAGNGGKAAADATFSFTFDADNTGGSYYIQYVTLHEVEQPSPDVFYVVWDEYLLDDGFQDGGLQRRRARFQVRDEAFCDFSNLNVEETSVGFQVTFDLISQGGAAKRAGESLFDISFDGDYFEPNLSATATPNLGAESLVLAAAPSVVHHHTTFQLSRALDQSASIRIYDLAGRLVKDLEFPAGAQSVTWNATDARGRSVASGAYIARVDSREGTATRKVTVVR